MRISPKTRTDTTNLVVSWEIDNRYFPIFYTYLWPDTGFDSQKKKQDGTIGNGQTNFKGSKN